MVNNKQFLQDIQDSYSILTNLTLVVVDLDGNEKTDMSGENNLSKLAFGAQPVKEFIIENGDSLKNLQYPVLFDNRLGLKYIVSPIRVDEQVVFYLLAGFILEYGSRDIVKSYIKQVLPELTGIDEALQIQPELSNEDKSEKTSKIKTLSTTIEIHLQSLQKTPDQDVLAFTYEQLELIRTGTIDMAGLVANLFSKHSQIDFLGVAIQKENEKFFIHSIAGNDSDCLKDQAFMIGEGFLGYAIASQQFQHWNDLRKDPRLHLFLRHGLTPLCLFCIPVYDQNKVIGLLFGGSYEHKKLNEFILHDFIRHSTLISTLLTTQKQKNAIENHLLELSTFNEIFKVMTHVKDMKRVFYILVDISLNIARGPFACVIYKPPVSDSKVDVISRGLSSDDIKDYCHGAALRFYTNTHPQVIKTNNPEKTNWGIDVLEFPLVFNGIFYGFLCIGLDPTKEVDNYIPFLSSLAMAGSISIHLSEDHNDIRTEGYLFQLIEELRKQQDQKFHDFIHLVNQHLIHFSHYLQDNDVKQLTRISGLLDYDESFLKKHIRNSETLSMVIECKNVLNQEKTKERNNEILALIYYYVKENENKDKLSLLTNISENVLNQFLAYLSQKSTVETEIAFNEPISISTSNTDLPYLKKLHLSPREIDVLNLILKGLNNREIAESLYISDHTVKNHVTRILQKLDVSDRSQAIAKIYQTGYTPPN